VFDGNLNRPYLESDRPNPLSIYGRTKLAGEQAIQATGVPHLIFRTSWVYGRTGKNFMLTMLRLAREKPELKIVGDQFGAPTWSRLIAQVTADILNRLIWQAQVDQESLPEVMGSDGGVYHLTAAGETNWYEFAKAIFAADPHASEQILTRVLPILTSAYPTPAIRPTNSRLDHRLLESTFGLSLPHWQEGLAGAIAP
jgi:dTDP-4-dehydrorhamnose reductase